MIDLQQQGLGQSREAVVAPDNDPSDPKEREEEGWESGDECQWSSEGGEGVENTN